MSAPLASEEKEDVRVSTNMDTDGVLSKPNSMDRLIENARAATDKEHKMTLLQGIRLYPKAVCWSVLISTCIVMEGYDVSLVGNLYGFDAFNRKYGVEGANGEYQVPARVSSNLAYRLLFSKYWVCDS